jgi:hypothetical protein
MANKAPKGKGSRAKLRDFFIENVGKILNSDTLKEVAGTSEWARRVRELRNEEGLNIVTHNDRSDLKPGQYLLFDKKPLPAFDRGISNETRAFVLDRNGFTCQMCGAAAGEIHPYDNGRKTRLHIGQVCGPHQHHHGLWGRSPSPPLHIHQPLRIIFGDIYGIIEVLHPY